MVASNHSATIETIPLESLYTDQGLLLTFAYANCSGACKPFLSSLHRVSLETLGLGTDYRILVVSLDPKETAIDMAGLSKQLGLHTNKGWIFGVVSNQDLIELQKLSSFWVKPIANTDQFDHPLALIAIRNGRIIRTVMDGSTNRHLYRELIAEMRGDFIPFYAQPGKTVLRCFSYDVNGNLQLDWGAILLILPAILSILIAIFIFRKPKNS
ncbi:MAG: hypothetical protein H3C43_09980 [Leptonema sp. (in: Bacteria)]|nr:hypothetical protein [Leptonema sp. (in: bacteria)]